MAGNGAALWNTSGEGVGLGLGGDLSVQIQKGHSRGRQDEGRGTPQALEHGNEVRKERAGRRKWATERLRIRRAPANGGWEGREALGIYLGDGAFGFRRIFEEITK